MPTKGEAPFFTVYTGKQGLLQFLITVVMILSNRVPTLGTPDYAK